MQTQILKTFRLGKSTVMTLPKSLGVTPGTMVKVKRHKQKIIIELDKENVAKKLAALKKIASRGFRSNLKYTPEDLNRWRDESYR